MSGPSKRTLRVAELIQQQIAECLTRHLQDPRLKKLVITEVKLSPDFKNATIYFTVIDKTDLALVKQATQKAAGAIRSYVSKTTDLKYIPQLNFRYDEHLNQSRRIQQLLDEIEDTNDENKD